MKETVHPKDEGDTYMGRDKKRQPELVGEEGHSILQFGFVKVWFRASVFDFFF